MPYDLMTFICKDAQDAAFSAARVPRRQGVRRLFIFLGSRPDKADIAWLNGDDMHLCLERAIELDDAENIAVRAALVYADSGGWNVLFCWAGEPPEDAEFDEARTALNKGERNMRRPHLWGTTREHVVLYGFDAAYRKSGGGEHVIASTHVEQFGPVNELEIGEALKGAVVSKAAMVAAIAETAPMQAVSLHPSVFSGTEKNRPLLQAIAAMATSMDAVNPVTVVLGTNPSKETLKTARASVPNHGAVVVLVEGDSPLEEESPYRTIKAADNLKALLFRQKK